MAYLEISQPNIETLYAEVERALDEEMSKLAAAGDHEMEILRSIAAQAGREAFLGAEPRVVWGPVARALVAGLLRCLLVEDKACVYDEAECRRLGEEVLTNRLAGTLGLSEGDERMTMRIAVAALLSARTLNDGASLRKDGRVYSVRVRDRELTVESLES